MAVAKLQSGKLAVPGWQPEQQVQVKSMALTGPSIKLPPDLDWGRRRGRVAEGDLWSAACTWGPRALQVTAVWSLEAVFQGRWSAGKHGWEKAGPKIPTAAAGLSSSWILSSCSLKSVCCLPHSYCVPGIPMSAVKLLLGWWMKDSPPASSLGKHSDVIAPQISTAPLFFHTFTSLVSVKSVYVSSSLLGMWSPNRQMQESPPSSGCHWISY